MKVEKSSPLYYYALSFRRAYEFAERHIESSDTGIFDEATKEWDRTRNEFERDLKLAVLKELDRIYKLNNHEQIGLGE